MRACVCAQFGQCTQVGAERGFLLGYSYGVQQADFGVCEYARACVWVYDGPAWRDLVGVLTVCSAESQIGSSAVRTPESPVGALNLLVLRTTLLVVLPLGAVKMAILALAGSAVQYDVSIGEQVFTRSADSGSGT